MRTLTIAALAVFSVFALSGCTSLNEAQSSCSNSNSDYSHMWGCIRERVAAGKAGMMNNEMGIRYMATGDAIDEKYKAGSLTSADAKMLLAQELSRANADFNAQYRPVTCSSSAVFNTIQTRCF